MVLKAWLKKLILAAGLHRIWRDTPPGSNDVPLPMSRVLLHTLLRSIVLSVAFRLFKWTWIRIGSKPSNPVADSDATQVKPGNKNREHGGQSDYLGIGVGTHKVPQCRVDTTALQLSGGHPLCVRTQGCEARPVSSIPVG